MDKLFTHQAIAEKYAELSRKRQMHRELSVSKGQTLAVDDGIQAVRETDLRVRVLADSIYSIRIGLLAMEFFLLTTVPSLGKVGFLLEISSHSGRIVPSLWHSAYRFSDVCANVKNTKTCACGALVDCRGSICGHCCSKNRCHVLSRVSA